VDVITQHQTNACLQTAIQGNFGKKRYKRAGWGWDQYITRVLQDQL
jgi:hypothetical protein